MFEEFSPQIKFLTVRKLPYNAFPKIIAGGRPPKSVDFLIKKSFICIKEGLMAPQRILARGGRA